MLNFQKFINAIVIILFISYLLQFIKNKKTEEKVEDKFNNFNEDINEKGEDENEEINIKDDLTLISKRDKQNKLNNNLMKFLDSYNFDTLNN